MKYWIILIIIIIIITTKYRLSIYLFYQLLSIFLLCIFMFTFKINNIYKLNEMLILNNI